MAACHHKKNALLLSSMLGGGTGEYREIAEGNEKTCSSIPCHLPSPAMWDYKYPEVFWKMEDQETMM
ncbi:unnamed protein product [Miscanthus lutarioriparius]|uniref:Uncharacterized protein n=1 Tax=Miscanthus lutarioriparius TaxID=422564 RepID=A0A811PKV1_9POAL|nr:unnamed protein product [Miscanthus lutarioriparius]CAD6272298.1 unnamed protein product [Miscanthus lutarioriparius]